jgi:ABC-type phosphate transport system ATPase subunit
MAETKHEEIKKAPKVEDTASGADMVRPEDITDPGVNPFKLREGNEFLKRDLGFSEGKCVSNIALANRIKHLRETEKFNDEVKKKLEEIEAELTKSAQ